VARQQSDASPTSSQLDSDTESTRAASTDALWSTAHIDVVEIALPGGVGYTLRAYRSDEEVEGTDISEREAEAFPDRHRSSRVYDHDEKALHDDEGDDDTQAHDFDSEFAAADTDTGELDPAELDDEADTDAEDDEDEDDEDEDDEDLEDEDLEDEEEDDDEKDAEDEAAEDDVDAEEIPIFLGHRGKLLLFRSAEGLYNFIKSDAPHDMEQLETWSELVSTVKVEDIEPLAEDTYELDLVVSNLRGNRDTWDADLLIRAGEIARDLGRSFEIEQVEHSLAAGSPLDDLDEALRASLTGGMGGFFGRRKLKKIGTEAAPLGWRTIIGKISGVVDWRD
jgi:hypothetical protein